MRPYHILAAGLICCFLSCQKEPDEDLLDQTPQVCRLDAITNYEDDSAIENAVYEYKDDKASRITFEEEEVWVTLTYSGDRLTKRMYYDIGGSTPYGIDTLIYNTDGTLQSVDQYVVDASLPAPYLFIQFSFNYSAGKLSLLEAKIDTSGFGPEPVLEYWYTHSGNNITQAIGRDLINGVSDTITYTYDTKTNYFSKNPALWLTDNLFMQFDGFLLPLALSGNNVTGIGRTDGSTGTVSYEATDQDEIETLMVDGELWSRYRYKCQ